MVSPARPCGVTFCLSLPWHAAQPRRGPRSPPLPEGRGTGGGERQTFPRPADGAGEGESTAEGGCCQLPSSPSAGGLLQSLPRSVTSQMQSI